MWSKNCLPIFWWVLCCSSLVFCVCSHSLLFSFCLFIFWPQFYISVHWFTSFLYHILVQNVPSAFLPLYLMNLVQPMVTEVGGLNIPLFHIVFNKPLSDISMFLCLYTLDLLTFINTTKVTQVNIYIIGM